MAVLWTLDEASTAVDGNGALLFGLDSRWGTQTTPPTFDDYTMSKSDGAGPSGQDACVLTYNPGSFASQGYLGGMKTVTAPAFGSSIYVGGYLKIVFSNYPNGAQGCKYIIIGNNAPSNRVILTWAEHYGADPDYDLRLQLDGGVSLITGIRFDQTWHQWEIELYPGASSGDTNGYYKLWTAAATSTFSYGSPTATQTGLSFVEAERAEFGSVAFGFFHGLQVGASETLSVSMADCFIADTFQATFGDAAAGGGTVTTQPVGMRNAQHQRRISAGQKVYR